MRELVLVHGRSQQHKDSVALKKEWIDTFREGLAKSGLSLPIPEDRIRFPYYGDTLDGLVHSVPADQLAEVVVRGNAADPQLRAFLEDDRDRGGVLTSTVRTFAASDLNLRVAAETLQIHQNTAQYRLNRIEERTGRNPRCIADLVDLLVAIELDR
jgi:hypothetical protein